MPFILIIYWQLEYNHVRPYMYSHSVPITNYGHNNQSMGHQWGGNWEFVQLPVIIKEDTLQI
jgi:hypothetical protein